MSWSGSHTSASWNCLRAGGAASFHLAMSTPTRVPLGQKWLSALLTPLSASAPMTAVAQLCAASHLQGNQGVADCLYPQSCPGALTC